jgi:hypothetical protein
VSRTEGDSAHGVTTRLQPGEEGAFVQQGSLLPGLVMGRAARPLRNRRHPAGLQLGDRPWPALDVDRDEGENGAGHLPGLIALAPAPPSLDSDAQGSAPD